MLGKFPKWILYGGVFLTFVSGYVNTIGLVGLHHQTLTHVTGAISNASASLAARDYAVAFKFMALLASFIGGAAVSGIAIRKSGLKLGRRYGVLLMVESMLLVFATFLLKGQYFLGDCLAASAFGLQNAMASLFSGNIVRTTHMTGIATDIGFHLGCVVTGTPTDKKVLGFYCLLLVSFLSGGATGASMFPLLGYDSLFIPAGIIGAVGAAYIVYRNWHMVF